MTETDAELFRGEADAADAGGVEAADEFFGDGVLEKDGAVDDGIEMPMGIAGADEVADAFDPDAGFRLAAGRELKGYGCAPRRIWDGQRGEGCIHASDPAGVEAVRRGKLEYTGNVVLCIDYGRFL